MNPLSFYVVTVNYNSSVHLQGLVESLRLVPLIKELIIVDHSPDHNLPKFSAPFPVTEIRQSNRGYGAGLNRGLRHIPERDAIVLMCNPDVIALTPDKLEVVFREFEEDPETAAIAPAIVTSSKDHFYSCRRFLTWKDVLAARMPFFSRRPEKFRSKFLCMDKDWKAPFAVQWASGCALFFRLQFFPSPICFDERFFLYFEDVDFCSQIHQQGLSIKYLPDMVFLHDEQRESIRSSAFLFILFRSLIKYIIKYRGLPSVENLQASTARYDNTGNWTR